MNKKLYQLANNINSEYYTDNKACSSELSELEIKKYSNTILSRIRETNTSGKDDRTTGSRIRRATRRISKYAAAAACAALLLGVTVFCSDVHAAIKHISWSLGTALGLSGDLENYRDIVNTSVTDNGYMITLQEAVATDEKLVVNYTIQREDGQSMGEIPMLPHFDQLYINGKNVTDSVSGGSGYIDDEHTVIGVSRTFDVFGVDMAKENTYQLKLDSLDDFNSDTKITGKWNFSFTADGSDLIADTKTVPVAQEFTVADGVTVTLEELTLNELEQRFTYHIDGSSDYLFRINATDSTGRQAQFDTKIQNPNGISYMQNQEIICDGRIDESADSVTLTLYAVEIPKESGRMSDDYFQIGEPFELNLR